MVYLRFIIIISDPIEVSVCLYFGVRARATSIGRHLDSVWDNICAFLTISAPRPPLPSSVPVDERFPVPMVQRYPDEASKWSVFVRKL